MDTRSSGKEGDRGDTRGLRKVADTTRTSLSNALADQEHAGGAPCGAAGAFALAARTGDAGFSASLPAIRSGVSRAPLSGETCDAHLKPVSEHPCGGLELVKSGRVAQIEQAADLGRVP